MVTPRQEEQEELFALAVKLANLHQDVTYNRRIRIAQHGGTWFEIDEKSTFFLYHFDEKQKLVESLPYLLKNDARSRTRFCFAMDRCGAKPEHFTRAIKEVRGSVPLGLWRGYAFLGFARRSFLLFFGK